VDGGDGGDVLQLQGTKEEVGHKGIKTGVVGDGSSPEGGSWRWRRLQI
jgi:hypothetical protein